MPCQGKGKLKCAGGSDITLGNCTVGVGQNRRLGSMLAHTIRDAVGGAFERFRREICSLGVLKLGHTFQIPDYSFVSTFCSPLEVVGYLRVA